MTEQITMIWRKGPEMKRSYMHDKERYVQKKEDLVDTLELEKIHEKIREEMNERVHNRELVGNRNSNPFMKDNNYIKDLDTQDKFLRPQNSSKDNTYLFFSESPPQLQKSAPSLLTSQAQGK